jgi:dTDP-4-amino-4,6-dideoxygalactose transaminase
MNTWLIPHFGLKRQYNNLQEELLDATHEALKEGTLVNGPFTASFESWLRDYTGCKFATVTHSGTQALEFIAGYHYDLSFLAGYDDPPKIRIPNLTYPATLNAFYTTGWEIELVDTDNNGLIKVDSYEDNLDTHTCFVGLYGATGNRAFYSPIIVDGAQHWLSTTKDQVGDGMAISFDPTKNLPSSGNGGAVVTNDEALYDWVNVMKNNGKPDHFYSGSNSKMSELECSHLLVRAKYIDAWQLRRYDIRKYYLKQFDELPIKCLSRGFHAGRGLNCHADQKFVIYTSDRNDLLNYLLDNGIEAKVHYPYALSELPISKDIVSKPDLISTSVALSRGLLSLPIYPELSDSEIETIADKVKEFYSNHK